MTQPSAKPPLEITNTDLKAALSSEAPPLLIDCREPEEFAICRIEGATHLPMGDIPTRQQEIDAERDIVIYCHHGQRSMNVALWMREQGFETVRSLSGGIEAWSVEIDPSVPRY